VHRHEIRVRYGECDQQGVVFNARRTAADRQSASCKICFASFLGETAHVGDRPVFTATLTHIGVAPGTTTPIGPPEVIRHHLGEAG
jgi:hypothetical protein